VAALVAAGTRAYRLGAVCRRAFGAVLFGAIAAGVDGGACCGAAAAAAAAAAPAPILAVGASTRTSRIAVSPPATRRPRLRGPPSAAVAADEDGCLVSAAAVAPTPDGEAATGTSVAAAAAAAAARVTAAGAPREEMRRGDGMALALPPPAEAVTELGEEAGVKLP